MTINGKEVSKKDFVGRRYLDLLLSRDRAWSIKVSGTDDKGYWAIWTRLPIGEGVLLHFTGKLHIVDDCRFINVDSEYLWR